jgi:hypothetical protein
MVAIGINELADPVGEGPSGLETWEFGFDLGEVDPITP